MAYKVIIAEKPSVAGEIAKIVGAREPHRSGPCGYLEGNGYRVTWAFGHLVGLETPEELGFTHGELPMYPQEWTLKVLGKKEKDGKETIDEGVQRQMKTLESLFRGADEIIVATDAGREGELIFRYIYEYLGCKTPFKRLWISSLTDEAIRKGLRELRPGRDYDSLSDAAHQRSRADWLVGYNASRALRLYTGYRGTLSLGRVQTPTLGMICDRYEKNKNFTPTPYWQIKASPVKDGKEFIAIGDTHHPTEQQGQADLSNARREGKLKVEKVEKKTVSTAPPLLYDLTALQRAANGSLSLTADETLKCAQSLYEKKLLTYPRTGSRYIPDDVYKTLPDLFRKLSPYGGSLGKAAGEIASAKLSKKSVDASKVTDHHALLPTGNLPSKGDLSKDELAVWEMVFARALEAFGEKSESEVTAVNLSCAGKSYTSHGSILTKAGWKAVRGADAKDTEKNENSEDDDTPSGQLPELREGEILPVQEFELLQKSDKPLPIYTDGSILAEMETCGKRIDDDTLRESMKDSGLGTPATRAATIEALIKRGYVERTGKKLLPTALGMQIWSLVKGRKIADVRTTGEWERDLGRVERGEETATDFSKGIQGFVAEIIDDLKNNCKPIEGSAASEDQRMCPICGKPMKNMKFSILCDEQSGGCGFKINREIAGKKLPASAIDSLAKGKTTPIIKGFTSKSGKKFDAALKVDKDAKKVAFDFPERNAGTDGSASGMPSLPPCPFCGGTLETVKGKVHCPECGFEMWMYAFGQRLSDSQVNTLLEGKKLTLRNIKSAKTGKTFSVSLTLDRDSREVKSEFVNDTPKKSGKNKTKH